MAISLAAATAVLLPDSTWHSIQPGTSLGAILDPQFTDPVTDETLTSGEPWVQFTDTAGQVYALPMRNVGATQLTAPVTPPA
jgi:hypothetical protein